MYATLGSHPCRVQYSTLSRSPGQEGANDTCKERKASRRKEALYGLVHLISSLSRLLAAAWRRRSCLLAHPYSFRCLIQRPAHSSRATTSPSRATILKTFQVVFFISAHRIVFMLFTILRVNLNVNMPSLQSSYPF